MVVGPGRGAINAHLPDDLAGRIRPSLRVRQNPVPRPIPAPAIQPVRQGLPRPVALRHVPPGRDGAQLPQDAIDDGAMVAPLAPTPPPAGRQQRGDDAPRRLRHFAASHHDGATLVPDDSGTSVTYPSRFVRQAIVRLSVRTLYQPDTYCAPLAAIERRRPATMR